MANEVGKAFNKVSTVFNGMTKGQLTRDRHGNQVLRGAVPGGSVVLKDFGHDCQQIIMTKVPQGLSRSEMAELVKQMLKSGLTETEAANALGKSQSYISGLVGKRRR